MAAESKVAADGALADNGDVSFENVRKICFEVCLSSAAPDAHDK